MFAQIYPFLGTKNILRHVSHLSPRRQLLSWRSFGTLPLASLGAEMEISAAHPTDKWGITLVFLMG